MPERSIMSLSRLVKKPPKASLERCKIGALYLSSREQTALFDMWNSSDTWRSQDIRDALMQEYGVSVGYQLLRAHMTGSCLCSRWR